MNTRQRWSKRLVWALGITTAVCFALYQGYFLVMPRVTINNNSGEAVTSVTVTLPNSRLVFGPLAVNSIDTIYYDLKQADGSYRYQVVYTAGGHLTAECGYLTANEIGKTFVISLEPQRKITCNGAEQPTITD